MMEQATDAELNNSSKRQYKQHSMEEKKELLDGKDKKSTQRATVGAVRHFNDFIHSKNMSNMQEIKSRSELNDILMEFYPAIQPIKDDEDYCVQTLKCIRSGLNRHIRKEFGWDICNDSDFVKSNEMFKAICVEAKKKGKGVRNSYQPISPVDLERIAEYFYHDHMNKPEPRKLQQQMIFYIIYYFCRCGRENLY